MLRFLVSSGIAVALAASPVAVSAQSRAPGSEAGEVKPAGEQVEGSELRRGFILPLLGVVAVIVLVYLLARKDKDEAFPVSP